MPEMATVAKANQAVRALSPSALSDALIIDASSALSCAFTEVNDACIFSSDACKTVDRTEEISTVDVVPIGDAANEIPRQLIVDTINQILMWRCFFICVFKL